MKENNQNTARKGEVKMKNNHQRIANLFSYENSNPTAILHGMATSLSLWVMAKNRL